MYKMNGPNQAPGSTSKFREVNHRMVVELIGGPLDGAVIDGPSHMPVYMIVNSHREGPVYRLGCCVRCAVKRQRVPYYFLGYEELSDMGIPKNRKISKRLNIKTLIFQILEPTT
jgi:hypothetical protein